MAGVPFEILEQLSTLQTARSARLFLETEQEFTRTKEEVARILASRRHNLSKEQFRAWRKLIHHGIRPVANDPPTTAFAACWESAERLAQAEVSLDQTLLAELDSARLALRKATTDFLPRYLVFAAGSLRDLLETAPDEPLPPRKKSLRARERHLLLYLQRVCAKNDTLSEFGPHGWGVASSEIDGVQMAPLPGISERETFLERWTAQGVAAAINRDPECALEIAPRLHPGGRIEGAQFVFTESGETFPLSAETLALLRRCDGRRPAHSLGADPATLRDLAEKKFLLWELEVPALQPHAFEVLQHDVAGWRDGPARRHWLGQLRALAELPPKFARLTAPGERLALITEAAERLENLGAHKSATRFLYAATNPIGEESYRACNFTISEPLLDEVALEAAPWIDLWRDSYAFVASRVAAALRGLFEQAPVENGALPLPAFLRHCANLRLPLTGPGMVAPAHLAFAEVREAFRARLQGRADETAISLSADDCHVVRQEFSYPAFDEFTYPSADLQLAAASVDAVGHGEYQWYLAELHPPVALLHHGFFWSCPDQPALAQALEQTLCGQPNLFYGYFAADFTATTTVRLDALAGATNFVAAQRSIGQWQTFHPAETEVFIDDQTGDVGLRARGSHQYLGSFARGWVIPLGFHPFSFSLGKNTPRFLCGKVIVQRRSWTVSLEELGTGDFTGISRELVVAVEKLRAARQLPRHIYIRPTEQALRRSGVEGRDKDTKPVYIDLESYLFLEIFHRWLTKARELEITEMSPTPDQLLWREPDGRRTFELRTQVIRR